MSNRLTTIKARNVVCFILYWTFFSDTLVSELHFPGMIQYLNDLAWIFLLFFIFRRGVFSTFKKNGCRIIPIILVAHLFLCYLSSCLNLVSPFLIIWASRNSLRFFVFYVATVMYFDKLDIEKMFNSFFYLQIISFILTMYQYYILGLKQDSVGGIFGHGNGAALNIFQIMVFIYYLCGFLCKKQPLYKLIIIFITSFLISVFAEEKVFFLYIAISLLGVILISKPSVKTCLILILAFLFVPYGLTMMADTNGFSVSFFSAEKLMEYGNGAYGISRIDPFSQINRLFFHDNIFYNLFGIGFGGAEVCAMADVFNSDFGRQYVHLQYIDFVHQKKFIETGYLGFGTFVLFIVVHSYLAIKTKLRTKSSDYKINYAIIFPIVCIVSCWMSGSLIFNDGYIPFWGLAVEVIALKEHYQCG